MKLKSINFKILLPLCLTVLVESFLILFCLQVLAKPTLEEGLINNFKSSIEVRTNYLETSMSNKWSNLSQHKKNIVSKCENFIDENDVDVNSILESEDLSDDFLLTIADILPQILSSNTVTNSFFVLNNDKNDAIFLNTKTPNKVSVTETIIDFCPYNVVNYYYQNGYNISRNAYEKKVNSLNGTNFFTIPLEYAKNNDITGKNAGYWGSDLYLNSKTIFTYAIPIVVSNTVLGVLGVGISSTYLQTSMSALNGDANTNIALLSITNNGVKEIFKAYSDYSLPSLENVYLNHTSYNEIYSFDEGNICEFVYRDKLNLENYLYDEELVLLGISEKNVVLKASNYTSLTVVLIVAIISILSVGMIHFFSFHLAKPIKNVCKEINENNITNIPKTKILEVDMLIEKVEYYFNSSLEFDQKLNRIIEDSGAKLAVAEYYKDSDYITTSVNFYSILSLNYNNDNVNKEEFIARIKKLKNHIISSSFDFDYLVENYFDVPSEFVLFVDDHYIRMKSKMGTKGMIITLIDLTKEYEERLRLEHERDYDILTKLLNRSGFSRYITETFKNQINSAALFMIDIDNLKKINDTYGHEYGDEYIKLVGRYLYAMSQKYEKLTVAHLSGDEFIMLLEDSTNSLVEEIGAELLELRKTYIECYNSHVYVSLSCGVSFYENNITYTELKKRADFAMYQVKRNHKNSIAYFDFTAYEDYKHEDVLIADLNKIIEFNLVKYAYQAIVDLHTGEIYAYEALMRPQNDNFKNPQLLVEYAKKYNRLYDIERLTFFNACAKFMNFGTDKKLFVNSIASQILNDEDFNKFAQTFKPILNRIVVEIIEEDFGQGEIINRKINSISKLDINYAIDDYGTGYNNISMLLDYTPKFIKLEGSLVRGIDHDAKKLQFTKAIVDFCKTNGISIIAESVETIEELRCIKALGCDYVQGYLIAKPDLEIKDITNEAKELILSVN